MLVNSAILHLFAIHYREDVVPGFIYYLLAISAALRVRPRKSVMKSSSANKQFKSINN